MAKVDYVFGTLGSWECRTVCAYLLDRSEEVFTFDELLTHLVTEARAAPEAVRPPSTQRRDLGQRLREDLIPRLVLANLVEFEAEQKLVRPGSALATVEQLPGVLESASPTASESSA